MTPLAYLGVFLLTMCVFFPIVGRPAGLFWLALLPLAALAWVLRARTTVSPRELTLRTVFTTRRIDWAQVQGIRLTKRGDPRLVLADDSEVRLPAVGYDRLRDLAEGSGGRIPLDFAPPRSGATTPNNASDTDSTPATTDADAADDGTDTDGPGTDTDTGSASGRE